jgi:dolichol kinase
MCGGDGLADIVGRRLGAGNKLWFNTNKSAAGSAAMFVGGFGLSLVLTAVFHSLGEESQKTLTPF